MRRALIALALAAAHPALADSAVPDVKTAAPDGKQPPKMVVVHRSGPQPFRPAVHFRTGTVEIAKEDRSVIDEVSATLRAHPEIALLRVEGHTDARGSEEYDLQLGMRRANVVRDALVAAGVPAARLTAVSFGKTRPIADNRTAEGRARNSRVEFTVVTGNEPPPQRR